MHWFCIVSETSWACQTNSRNTDHLRSPCTKNQPPAPLPKNRTFEHVLKSNLPPRQASLWFLDAGQARSHGQKQEILTFCPSDTSEMEKWVWQKRPSWSGGERQEVGPKGWCERLPADLKGKKFCGRGLFFMLFQAGPENCLDKFTWTQSDRSPLFCFQRAQ